MANQRGNRSTEIQSCRHTGHQNWRALALFFGANLESGSQAEVLGQPSKGMKTREGPPKKGPPPGRAAALQQGRTSTRTISTLRRRASAKAPRAFIEAIAQALGEYLARSIVADGYRDDAGDQESPVGDSASRGALLNT